MSLLEDPLKPLQPSEYVFKYHFTSDGEPYHRTIFDWEVQAAWFNFKRRYGPEALDHLKAKYQDELPSQNLHFIVGTQLSHPHQFIIVGLLRTTENLATHQSLPEFDF